MGSVINLNWERLQIYQILVSFLLGKFWRVTIEFKNNFKHISILQHLFFTGLTVYHTSTDGGQLSWVEVLTSDEITYRCEFQDFLDGTDFEVGKNCRRL